MKKKQYEKHQDLNIKKEILSVEALEVPKPEPVSIPTKSTGSKRKPNFDVEDVEMESKEEEEEKPKKKESKKIEVEDLEEEENLISSKSGKVTHLYNENLSDTVTKDSLSQNKFSLPCVTKRLQSNNVRFMNDEPATRSASK